MLLRRDCANNVDNGRTPKTHLTLMRCQEKSFRLEGQTKIIPLRQIYCNGMPNSRHPTTPQNAKNRQPQKQLPALLFSGLAEIRTPVRTRKPYVFYMLISAFGFRATARPEPPTVTLSSKLHPCTEAYTGYFRFTCTA